MNKKYEIICFNKCDSKIINDFKSYLKKNKFSESNNNPDYLFIFGGDGTFIKTLQNYYNKKVKIVLINYGNVGFYAFYSRNNLPTIKDILNEKNFINPSIIEVTQNKQKYYAINEFILNSLHVLKSDIYLNDNIYQSFKGTGILITTSTGSTGYCRSAKGAVIEPSLDAYELVELNSINHSNFKTLNAPLILSSKTQINLKNINSENDIFGIADGIIKFKTNQTNNLTIKLIKSNIKIFYNKNIKSYLDKIKETFIK